MGSCGRIYMHMHAMIMIVLVRQDGNLAETEICLQIRLVAGFWLKMNWNNRVSMARILPLLKLLIIRINQDVYETLPEKKTKCCDKWSLFGNHFALKPLNKLCWLGIAGRTNQQYLKTGCRTIILVRLMTTLMLINVKIISWSFSVQVVFSKAQ